MKWFEPISFDQYATGYLLSYPQKFIAAAVGAPEVMLLLLVEHTIVALALQLVLQVAHTIVEGFASTKDSNDSYYMDFMLMNKDCLLVGELH